MVVNDRPQSSLIQKVGQQFSISEQMCSTLAINGTERIAKDHPSKDLNLLFSYHNQSSLVLGFLHLQYKEIDSSTDAAIAYWLLYSTGKMLADCKCLNFLLLEATTKFQNVTTITVTLSSERYTSLFGIISQVQPCTKFISDQMFSVPHSTQRV